MIKRFSAYGFLKNLRFFEIFLMVYFHEQLGLKFWQIGILYSVKELSAYLLELPTGVIADMFGKKRSMILCFLFYIASFIMFGVFKNIYALAGAMVLFGFADAFRTGTHKAIIMDWLDANGLERKKTHYYGYTRSWSKIGSAVNAVIAGALGFFIASKSNIDLSFLFYASVVPYLFGLFLMMSYPPDVKDEEKEQTIKGHLKDTKAALKNNTKMVLNASVFDAVFKASKDFIQPIVALVMLKTAFMPEYNSEQNNAIVLGSIYFIVAVISAIASRKAGSFQSKFKTDGQGENLLFILSGVAMFFMAIFTHKQIFAGIAAVYLLITAFYNIRRPMMVGFIGSRIDGDKRATVLSIESMITTIITAVLAPLFGVLADHSLSLVFVACGLIYIFMVFPLLLNKDD